MMGLNADGDLVKLTNRCACGHSMPLPAMANKACPECGQTTLGIAPRPGSPLESALRGDAPVAVQDDSKVSF